MDTALAHDRLSLGTALSDEELSEIVQGTRIDLSIWLRYEGDPAQKVYLPRSLT